MGAKNSLVSKQNLYLKNGNLIAHHSLVNSIVYEENMLDIFLSSDACD
ncbi:hypothetical protein M23134_03682 [Microscilla marina ATCC 23134]|uniref:Uncharacterized protein n=1 Tax=Microscilla marina ATCC 23134 TaxID=313606 RepID=A1ZX94_MICM2|nr:hypothetical protein M23134_03682 [Microscilla marina ATCC 23134]